jgi:hypothetical protein
MMTTPTQETTERMEEKGDVLIELFLIRAWLN